MLDGKKAFDAFFEHYTSFRDKCTSFVNPLKIRKSIENAMDILINLSGTGKLVGIISHREELMENIPQQIRVKKTRDGSKLIVETGV